MAVKITAGGDGQQGRNLFASLTQIDVDGTLLNDWNNTTGAWVASASDTDAKIPLTEGTGRGASSYSGGVSGTLGTYTGSVWLRIHDDDLADITIGESVFESSDGNEVTLAAVTIPTTSVVVVAPSRTWYFGTAEQAHARQVVHAVNGSTITVAFDWTQPLKAARIDLQSVTSVTVDEIEAGAAPVINNQRLNATRTQVHAELSSLVVGRYKLKALAVTTDGQTFAGIGTLHVT